jgi:hypothetical protein
MAYTQKELPKYIARRDMQQAALMEHDLRRHPTPLYFLHAPCVLAQIRAVRT